MAYGKPVTSDVAMEIGSGSNAVDGDINPSMSAGSCFEHGFTDTDPWVMVDLQDTYSVHSVTIFAPDERKYLIVD